jgi:hypothetical protein
MVAKPETLPRCGASISALAWFYEGVRDAGLFRAQQNVDGLMQMRADLRREALSRGAEHLDRLRSFEKAEIAALNRSLIATGDTARQAIERLQTDVAACIVVFFERED